MIAFDRKESVQQKHEAAVKCLQSKGFIFNRHNNGSSVEGLPKLKDRGFAPPGGDYVEPDPSLVSEPVTPAKEFHKSLSYSSGFKSWPNIHPYSKHVQYWPYALGNQICSYPINTRLQCAQVGYLPQSYSYGNHLQGFQYFVVIDFEATCDEGTIPNPQEIIEFPSVIVNGVTGQLEACFQTYVRPTYNQKLSDFCKDLTGIQQSQVDRGVTLSEALLRHDKWLEQKGLKNCNFAVVTWSNWDCRVMLESECQYKDIRKPDYYNRWINLKVPFQHVFGGGRFVKLKEAVEMAGLTWQGRPHCGLDDAKNTARLLSLIMHKGFKFSITNKLEGQSPNNSTSPPHQPASPQQHPVMFQFYPCCFCGVKSKQGRFCKPGPKLGSVFFSCGNWTPARGNLCVFFQWASP